MASTSQLFENVSTLQSLVRAKPSGCNPATRLILRAQRDAWEWGDTPRSHSTYTREGLTNINPQQFSKAMQRIRANILPPSTQWTNITIFLRTTWTNVKEANSHRNQLNNNPVSPNCSNCRNDPERTKHLFYECPLAQNLWSTIIADFNELIIEEEPLSTPIQLSPDMIMFNQAPQSLSEAEKTDLIDVIMTLKHRIYRYKFRDNMQRIPSHRETTLFSALDIDRIILIRQHNGLEFSFLNKLNDKLKTRVGLL